MSTTVEQPWSDDLWQLFERFGKALQLTPPPTLKSTVSKNRRRLRLVGEFRQADQTIVVLVAVAKCDRRGEWYQVEETMKVHLTAEGTRVLPC
jgi:hypothetical protein